MTERAVGEPIRASIAGVEVVTIPLSHYAELLDCQRRMAEVAIGPSVDRHPALRVVDPRSRLFGDPEVTICLYELFCRSTLKDAHAACMDRFGWKRCPSRATIARYWNRLRGMD